MIIVGASARAAAASALRAGYAPWCVDLFADADLQRACPVRRVAANDYPEGLVTAMNDAPSGPCLYTGALENRPDVVARIGRPLWGNPPEVLRKVRSPALVEQVLRRQGIPCPAIAVPQESDSAPSPAITHDQTSVLFHKSSGRWLVKPLRSAGGAHIHFVDSQRIDPSRFYGQEWIDGSPCSAVFVGLPNRAALFLGATRQLIGEPWLHAVPFQWCGNIGPLPLTAPTRFALERMGTVLVEDFALRGLFGVDFILRDDVPWPIEVNPRYPASVEVLERATGMNALQWHSACFGREQRCWAEPFPEATVCAKAILFAKTSFRFPQHGPWQSALSMSLSDCTVPFADLPTPDMPIATGHPVLSFFATAATVKEGLTKLQERAAELDRCF